MRNLSSAVLAQKEMTGKDPRESLPLSYLHVDCDLYAGSRDALTLLSHKIVPGTVILFDELVNYNTYREHEVCPACLLLARHICCQSAQRQLWIGLVHPGKPSLKPSELAAYLPLLWHSSSAWLPSLCCTGTTGVHACGCA